MSKKNKKDAHPSTRQVIYPKWEKWLAFGDDALTAAKAKEFLEWEETEGDGAMFTDEHGKKIICRACVDKQRPFYEDNCERLIQDILNKRWRKTHQGVGIGKTGRVLDAKHRLIALVRAKQRWEKSSHWQEIWETEPTIEIEITKGIDEDDETVCIIDYTRPRTGSDILYSSVHFQEYLPKDRKHICRAAEYALSMLWERSGAGVKGANNFTPLCTNSELEGYLKRHPRMVKCLKHIWDENQEKAITKYISSGYASAYLYFMGSGTSDGDSYRHMDTPAESGLKWDLWDRAREFWSLLGVEGDATLQAVRLAIKGLKDPHSGNNGSLEERTAVLAKAWEVFSKGGTPTLDDLRLKYIKESTGGKPKVIFGHSWEILEELRSKNESVKLEDREDYWLRLAESPSFGGIDLGNPKNKDFTDTEEDSEEAITERKAEIRKAKAAELSTKLNEMRREKKQAGQSLTQEDELELIREEWPDYLLIFRRGTGEEYQAWGQDASNVSKIVRVPIKQVSGMANCTLLAAKVKDACLRLQTAGYKVALCDKVNGEQKVVPFVEQEPEEEIDVADPSPEEQEASGEAEQEAPIPVKPDPAKKPAPKKPPKKTQPKKPVKAKAK